MSKYYISTNITRLAKQTLKFRVRNRAFFIFALKAVGTDIITTAAILFLGAAMYAQFHNPSHNKSLQRTASPPLTFALCIIK